MPGRTTYTQTEVDRAESAIADRVAVFDKLVLAVDRAADQASFAEMPTKLRAR